MDMDFPMGLPWKTQLCVIRIDLVNYLEDSENIWENIGCHKQWTHYYEKWRDKILKNNFKKWKKGHWNDIKECID